MYKNLENFILADINNNCVNIEEKTILLRSFLEEQTFARTDLSKIMNENGILALVKDSGDVELLPWQFNVTKVLGDKTVAFEGSAFNGKTLASTFVELKQTDSPSAKEKIVCVFKVLDKLMEEIENSNHDKESTNSILPGPEGIIVSDKIEDGSFKVLLLPGNLFERCAQNSADYAEFQGSFIHRGLEGLESIVFTRASLAYTAVTGTKAFSKTKLEERQADITDLNFIPVEYEVNGIEEELAHAIDSGLSVKNKKRIIPGERRFINEKEENNRKETLKSALKLNSTLIKNFFNSDKTQNKNSKPQELFNAERNSFLKKQAKQIKIKRFYARNSKRIWGSAAAIILALSVAFNFNRENKKLATSLGLTSTQTVQALFAGIHSADVTVIQEIAKGKDSKALVQTVSGFFVTNKQRLAMDERDGTLSPAQWLFFKGQTEFWQYGITNLKIDGQESVTTFSYPRRQDKPVPLTEENGKTLKKGDETKHTVSYNLVYNEGESVITVYKTTEEVTLRWNGKRWIVRSIKGTGKTSSNGYSVKKYKADYIEALEKCSGDVKQAAGILRQKYSFTPTEQDLRDAVPFMIEKYNNSAAKDFK